MRTAQRVFLVLTEEGRESYQLVEEQWSESFRGGASRERDTRQTENVSITAWIASSIRSEGKKSGMPPLKESRDEGKITWIRFDGGDAPEFGLPIVDLANIISLNEARQGTTFVTIMKTGDTRVFTDNISI